MGQSTHSDRASGTHSGINAGTNPGSNPGTNPGKTGSNDDIVVGSVDDVRADGVRVVRGRSHNIAVFADGAAFRAVDNRCPHMGFPLDRGSVKDGMLTCHWHQARFDLKSGCTFDLWADDVIRFRTRVVDGNVLVAAEPEGHHDVDHHLGRLERGLEQNVGLVQAKSLLALLESGTSVESIVTRVARFAARNLPGWSEGLTRLGCVLNLSPYLSAEGAYEALYYATRQIGQETAAAVPHRNKPPLDGDGYDAAELDQWLRQWVRTRHRDGAERTLLTAAHTLEPADFSRLLTAAATERLYAAGGHLLEDCNKALDMGAALGDTRLLPLLVESLTQSRGEEESTNWHHPIAIADPILSIEVALEAELPSTTRYDLHGELADVLLGEDPLAIIEAMREALRDGATPQSLAREVAYAAALRLARFATSNEVTDWFNPQHTFINCNAAYRAVCRQAAPATIRAVFQAAMSVYIDRFLNVPPARLPEERGTAAGSVETLAGKLDTRGDIDEAADIVAEHFASGGTLTMLVDELTRDTVREDLDFHSLQVLEAATSQCVAWGEDRVRQSHIMVGAVRNLAAHCPTRRAGQQTARIAKKLQRGEAIYEGA